MVCPRNFGCEVGKYPELDASCYGCQFCTGFHINGWDYWKIRQPQHQTQHSSLFFTTIDHGSRTWCMLHSCLEADCHSSSVMENKATWGNAGPSRSESEQLYSVCWIKLMPQDGQGSSALENTLLMPSALSYSRPLFSPLLLLFLYSLAVSQHNLLKP